jgi:hypothetical protein
LSLRAVCALQIVVHVKFLQREPSIAPSRVRAFGVIVTLAVTAGAGRSVSEFEKVQSEHERAAKC